MKVHCKRTKQEIGNNQTVDFSCLMTDPFELTTETVTYHLNPAIISHEKMNHMFDRKKSVTMFPGAHYNVIHLI
jgi:hypothetical protein